MDTTELVEWIRDGERFAPDRAAVLAALDRRHRAKRRQRRAVQIGSVAAAVVLIAAAATIIATRPAPNPVSPPRPDDTELSVVPTTIQAAPVTVAELARYRWSTMPDAPIAERDQAAIGWTGTEMLVWGGVGVDAKGSTTADLADGAAYNPATKTWRVLPTAPVDARIPQTSVWTGTEFIVWGGDHGETDGAAYDPTTNTWRTIPAVPGPTAVGATTEFSTGVTITGPPTGLQTTQTAQTASGPATDFPTGAVAVWTGKVMQLLTWRYQGPSIQSWYYDPSRNSWTQGDPIQPTTNALLGEVQLVVSGDEIDVIVGWSATESGGMYDRVTGYRRTSGDPHWRPVAYHPALQRVGPVVVAGAEILQAGGQPYVGFHSSPLMTVPGARLNPATGAVTPLPAFPAPVDQPAYNVAWTGAALLGYGADEYAQKDDGTTQLPGLAAAWDPGTNAWTALEPAPLSLYGVADGVWTGTQLLSWGLMFPSGRANDPDRQVRAAGLVFGPAG